MKRTSSIIDYPRNKLDKSIWDTSGDEVKLVDKVEDQVLDIVHSFLDDFDLPKEALIDILIYGSILTNQYNSKTDVDARIVLDPDITWQKHPEISGDDMYNVAKKIIHDVPIEGTEHTFNATVVILGEQTELAQSNLGITPKDPVYSVLDREIVHEGEWYTEEFDPDKEFSAERQQAEQVMEKLDKLITEVKTDTIDIDLLKEAVADVDNPKYLYEKIEEKVQSLKENIAELVSEHDQIKQDRRDSYKNAPKDTDRHRNPGNVTFKILEKYKYVDVLQKLKQIFSEGITENDVDEVADAINVVGLNIDYPGQNVDPPAPPTSVTEPITDQINNPNSYESGGFMHGATCPKCGTPAGINAKHSKKIKCEKCGNEFELEGAYFNMGAPGSTLMDTAPYQSDVQIYGQLALDTITKALTDAGVPKDKIQQVQETVETDTTKPPNPGEKDPKKPMVPTAPNAPKAPGTQTQTVVPATPIDVPVPEQAIGQNKGINTKNK
jgi:ribosomal protein S27E